MSTRIPQRISILAEFCLWVAGGLAIAYCVATWVESSRYQAEGNRELDQLDKQPRAGNSKVHPARGSLVGRLEIPRIGLSVVVFEGTDAKILGRGVGHLANTALPGQTGNVVLAAHRDTFFRGLQNIRKSDIIHVVTPNGKRQYIVESMSVVNPEETEVLEATSGPVLTLVTCYPFRYVGPAPKRFIVRCRQKKGVA
jgi:sortase A